MEQEGMAVNPLIKQRKRGRGGPSTRGLGQAGGAASGSRNAATELAQALLDGEADALVRRCVERALEAGEFDRRLKELEAAHAARA
jgi:hypothetical protein